MYKIAVMGDRDSIYGFASVGLEIVPVEDMAHAGRQLRQLAESGYGIIYITESLCGHLEKELELYSERVLPAIIPVPGVSGNNGLGVVQVKRSVERAVGSDILFGNS